MKKILSIPLFAALVICTIMIIPVFAADTAPSSTESREKVILYQTDFSTNPLWQTNNPTRYFWNPENKMYHYLVQANTGGYTYVPVKYDGESFTIEYDFYPIRTDKDATFRFGIGSSEMDVTRGTNALSEFSNKKFGKIMWLQVITQNNHLIEVSSASDSYAGPTINFEDNQTYHVVIRYNKELMNSDIKVGYKNNQTVLWGYYLNIGQELHTLDRLMISSVGDYGNIDASAEGYIDNVVYYTYRDVTPTPTTPAPTISSVPTVTPTAPATAIPTTKSPVSTLTFFVALGICGITAVLSGGRKN